MREAYLEWRDHWPAEGVPEDLLSYFVSEQLLKYPNAKLRIHTREHFLELLDQDPFFEQFWKQLREAYPKKADYFASLMDDKVIFKSAWIECEYYRYLYKEELNRIPEDERDELQAQFDKIRPEAYQAALRGEAVRLNCKVSEVRPICQVLPLTTNDEQSEFADLPDVIFLNVVNRLDTLDVFRVTLVCKRWKSMICDNPRDLKRAEHSKTTHLITFTDWLDPSKTPSCLTFESRYENFTWGLIRWCCGISENLETVILDQPISYIKAVALTQSCPNLKNLQIGCYEILEPLDGNAPFSSDLVLPKLEFYSSRMFNLEDGVELDAKVLLSSESLLYFEGQLVVRKIPLIDVQDRMKCVFGNLVALDLVEYSFLVLEFLEVVDDLQLRYLSLGYAFASHVFTTEVLEINKLQYQLERILPKLKMLEILKIDESPGIGSSTIKLLTELKLNLKLAVFAESEALKRRDGDNNPIEGDYWKAPVLEDLGQMLLSNDPGLDLSKFCFIVMEKEIPQDLREMNLGFTFIPFNSDKRDDCDIGLHFQSIKRRLSIDF